MSLMPHPTTDFERGVEEGLTISGAKAAKVAARAVADEREKFQAWVAQILFMSDGVPADVAAELERGWWT